MTQSNDIHIQVQMTPNPNSLQFIANVPFVESGSYNFESVEDAHVSPLASELFQNESVAGVLIGSSFVTISKKEAAHWNEIAEGLVETLRSFLASGKKAVSDAAEPVKVEGGSEIEQTIRQVIDSEIRPAVARDGGDVVFESYEDGVVQLRLQGACSSCPSSVMTLKMGIENRLRQVVPEIREVVSV